MFDFGFLNNQTYYFPRIRHPSHFVAFGPHNNFPPHYLLPNATRCFQTVFWKSKLNRVETMSKCVEFKFSRFFSRCSHFAFKFSSFCLQFLPIYRAKIQNITLCVPFFITFALSSYKLYSLLEFLQFWSVRLVFVLSF